MACDLCGSENSVEAVRPSGQFRGIRNLCLDHAMRVETIHMGHVPDAWRYGKPDWHERLVKNVRSDLKRFYRKHGRRK